MSNLAKKRVHWYEVNENNGEVIADEDVDVLTSADAVTFDDGDTLQRKYDDKVLARTSDVGNIKGLNTSNKSSLVDAVNEVVTKTTTNAAAIDNVLSTSKSYTDTKVANLVGAAPETLNTLEEVAQAIDENEDVVTALNGAIGNKANQVDLDTLTNSVNNNATNIGNLTTRVTNIEEELGFELTSTLSTGSTSLTFTDSRITTNSTLVAVYTSIFGVAVKSAVFENESLTLTFPAQTEDMTVKVVIK